MTALRPQVSSFRARLAQVPLSRLGMVRVLVAAVLTLTSAGQVVALTGLTAALASSSLLFDLFSA